ncbi:MAG: SDR family NAD(P)-dependent oxidoreductase, partial [Candidatus Binatia bacterium]
MSRHNAAVVVGVGAEAGLGAALCRRLAAEGLWVLVAGRTADKLNKVVSTIKSRGQSATAVVTDATKEDQVVALFDAAERLVDGPLEFVAYNAGNNRMAGLLEMEAAFFEDAWRVACFGGFLVGREAARRMAPRTQGTIAFTGASASLRGRPPFTAFASAKAGLRSLAQAMAREFGPSG